MAGVAVGRARKRLGGLILMTTILSGASSA
jgi:hypothetical protein